MKNKTVFPFLAVLLFVAISFARIDASASTDACNAKDFNATSCTVDLPTDALSADCLLNPDCCLQVDSDGNYTCEALATTVSCAIDVTYDQALEACNDANITVIVFRGYVQINYLPAQVSFQVPLCPC